MNERFNLGRRRAFWIASCGLLYASACTLADFRQNLISGTLAFVEDYTTGLWNALTPDPEEIVGDRE